MGCVGTVACDAMRSSSARFYFGQKVGLFLTLGCTHRSHHPYTHRSHHASERPLSPSLAVSEIDPWNIYPSFQLSGFQVFAQVALARAPTFIAALVGALLELNRDDERPYLHRLQRHLRRCVRVGYRPTSQRGLLHLLRVTQPRRQPGRKVDRRLLREASWVVLLREQVL